MSRVHFAWLRRQSDAARPLFHNRYADEWVGFLVLLSLVLFGGAVVEAGFLREWLKPAGRIHFVLPQNGMAGLAVGNDIEVMGVRAGEIRKLELNDSGRMYAEGIISPQFERFIRSDSTAIIRRRFVVAGASYIEVSRGRSQTLDWGFAVLRAVAEPNPADMVSQTVKDIRASLVPAMVNVKLITEQVRGILTDMHAGRGTVGGLLNGDETLAHINAVLATLNDTIAAVQPLEKQLQTTIQETNGTLVNVRQMSDNLKDASPDMRETIKHMNEASAQLPALLIEAEASANSLRHLADQLRGMWFLGGSGTLHHEPRLSGYEVRP